VTLVSKARGKRDVPVSALYGDDGMAYLRKGPDEILTEIRVPAVAREVGVLEAPPPRVVRLPVMSVAAWVKMAGSGEVEDARVVLGAVTSRPLEVPESAILLGSRLTDR